jgi:hypothetical protein
VALLYFGLDGFLKTFGGVTGGLQAVPAAVAVFFDFLLLLLGILFF